jgi:hypothetical protein
MKTGIPSRSRSFSDPAPPRYTERKIGTAPNFSRKIGSCPYFPYPLLHCGDRGPRKNINSRFRDLLFSGCKGLEGKIILSRVAWKLACLGLLVILLTGRPVLAATELHGADSSFRGQGITVLWAILKGGSEASTVVHIRILRDAGATPALDFFGIEAVDPFSKERAWVLRGEPLGAIQTLKSVRTEFRDKTERWLHFYTDREALEKGRPALTIFYRGVPDTAPEVLSETQMEAYFLQALSRIQK